MFIKAILYLETIPVLDRDFCFYKCKIRFSFTRKNSIIDEIHKFLENSERGLLWDIQLLLSVRQVPLVLK